MPVNMFQPYEGQQVQPVPQGFLAAYGQVGENLRAGLDSVGQSIGQGFVNYKQLQQQGKAADMFIKSYDTKDANGNTVNPILDQMGVHRDAVDTMGARDKIGMVTGFMQAQGAKAQSADMQAQAQERQMKAMMLQQQGEEADAMGKIAGPATAWSKANPGKQPTQMDVLGWMDGVKMNPRTQGAIMSKMLPGMMQGSTLNPQGWTSPEGNPYVFLKGQLLPDRTPISPGDVTPPDGYEAVPDGKGNVRYLRQPTAKTMPPTAQNQLTQYLNDYTSANNVLSQSDDELKGNAAGLSPAQLKTSAQTRLKRSQQNAKNLLDMQHELGTLDDDKHASFLQSFGLGEAPAASGGGTGTGAGGAGTAGAAARMPVWKDGKQFTVPVTQKDLAAKQGYSLTPPK